MESPGQPESDEPAGREEPGAPVAQHTRDEMFRLLVASVVDYAIFLLEPDGTIASWNAGAERMKGYRADEIIGEHFSRFYTPDDIARHYPQHELAIGSGDLPG